MIYPNRKTVITAIALTGAIIIIFWIAQGFKGFGNTQGDAVRQSETEYSITTFKLPDIVTFAGEKMPLDNFDTRESLEREILISAYRHSSTILIIKKSQQVSSCNRKDS